MQTRKQSEYGVEGVDPSAAILGTKIHSLKNNKVISHSYAIRESPTGLTKASPTPQPTHSIDDHGICMTNLPEHWISNMTAFRRRKNIRPLNLIQGSMVC